MVRLRPLFRLDQYSTGRNEDFDQPPLSPLSRTSFLLPFHQYRVVGLSLMRGDIGDGGDDGVVVGGWGGLEGLGVASFSSVQTP